MGAKRTWSLRRRAPRGVSGSESNPNNIQRGGEATLLRQHSVDRPVNVSDGSTGMRVVRKSDGSVGPAKFANKGGPKAPAEWMEEWDPAERNIEQADLSRAQNRNYGNSNGMFGMREMILRGGFAFDSRQEPDEVVPLPLRALIVCLRCQPSVSLASSIIALLPARFRLGYRTRQLSNY